MKACSQKRKLAGPQLDWPVRKVFPELCESPLGVELDCRVAKDAPSDDQRRGFHWLLHNWLRLDPGVSKNLEELKSKVLILKFGPVFLTDQHGNQKIKPAKRTTQEWDWDDMAYRKKKLSKKLYTELIEFVYDTAAQDGVVLPEMNADMKRELLRAA